MEAREGAVDERLPVVRVDQDDGDAGGRAEDAGRARGAARDRVEDRALAGAGRADEEDDHGGVQRCRADPHMTAEMVGELAGAGRRGLAPRAQRQAALRERLETLDEGAQIRCGQTDHGLRLASAAGSRRHSTRSRARSHLAVVSARTRVPGAQWPR